MARVVFDTVIFVRCLINPRGRWGRLVFSHAARYQPIVSKPILTEILEVLSRPELVRTFRSLEHMDMRGVLALLAQAEVVELDEVPAVARDPKDDKFLATAARASADYLVTEDKGLLVIGEYKGIMIVTAETFLGILTQQQAP